MYVFSRPLGDTVKKARRELGLTQAKVADTIDIDARTIMNIENYIGNPKTEILFPLLRTLKIDPWSVFYPELQNTDGAFRQLQLLLSQCSDSEIESLLPIIKASLTVLKSENNISIEND